MKREFNPIVRYRENPTRKKAMTAFCAQCMGCSDEWVEPGFREEIRNCSAPKCALYPYRPFQEKKPQTKEKLCTTTI